MKMSKWEVEREINVRKRVIEKMEMEIEELEIEYERKERESIEKEFWNQKGIEKWEE